MDLLTTKGKWYDHIAFGKKAFDLRRGHRNIQEGDIVCFKEADIEGNATGRKCFGRVTYVVHSEDFPKHFGWESFHVFTVIQFVLMAEVE